jgi:hypothetical protein
VEEWLKPIAGNGGKFRAAGVAFSMEGAKAARDIELAPFYKLHRRWYAAYWDLIPRSEYDRRVAAVVAEKARQDRLAAATLTYVPAGDSEAEKSFRFEGDDTTIVRVDGRAGRRSGKWFAYQIPIDGTDAAAVIVTYNSDNRRERTFDVFVDGTRIASETMAKSSVARFIDVPYILPPDLVRGRRAIEIRFEATQGNDTAVVFGIRLARSIS